MRSYLTLHLAAFVIGLILDLIIGDPHSIPHPVTAIGSLIAALEKKLYPGAQGWNREEKLYYEGAERSLEEQRYFEGEERSSKEPTDYGIKERNQRKELRRGVALCVIVMAVTFLLTAVVLFTAYYLHPALGFIAETVMTCYLLAAKSLYTESMKVSGDLKRNDITKARADLSMIVGRDTAALDRSAVCRAAVETVAENTSDGVIAPLLYAALFGPAFGMLYKSVNTMDSMLGYRNDRYEYFGKCAAKLDDVANYIPARLSALFMIAGCALAGMFSEKYNAARAFRVWRRDRRNHKSPNSAQTESVCAGAFGLRLGGDSIYQGHLVRKPYIGDEIRAIEAEDIRRANVLMFAAEIVAAAVVACILGIWICVFC